MKSAYEIFTTTYDGLMDEHILNTVIVPAMELYAQQFQQEPALGYSEELIKEANDILALNYLKNPVPEWMPKQKRLIEFSKKVAEMITAATHSTHTEVEECYVPLTEENIMKLRRVERDDYRPFEFSVQSPGERQIENQYWSNFIHEDYKLHLCPSYKTEWPNKNTAVKSKEIDFWFIWYCEGNRFLPLMNIRQHKLQYIHQLQDLFKCITGKKLIIEWLYSNRERIEQ